MARTAEALHNHGSLTWIRRDHAAAVGEVFTARLVDSREAGRTIEVTLGAGGQQLLALLQGPGAEGWVTLATPEGTMSGRGRLESIGTRQDGVVTLVIGYERMTLVRHDYRPA